MYRSGFGSQERASKTLFRDEERIKRAKSLQEFSMTTIVYLILRLFTFLATTTEQVFKRRMLVYFPTFILIYTFIIIMCYYVIKYGRRKVLFRHLDIVLVMFGYLILLTSTFELAKIQDSYIRGLSQITCIIILNYYGQFLFRSLYSMFATLLIYLIQYITYFPHESTAQFTEALFRIIFCFAFSYLSLLRFLKESKQNFELRQQLKQKTDLIHQFMNSMTDRVIIYSKKGIIYQNINSMSGVLTFTDDNLTDKCKEITQVSNIDISLLDIIYKYFEKKELSIYKDQEFNYFDNVTAKLILLNITLLECGLIDENSSLAMIIKDITDKRKKEERASRKKYTNQIMNSLSHEIRTPLNGIMGMIQISKEKIKDKEIKMHLGLAESSGFFLKNQLADIEDCGKIVAGNFVLHSSNFCIPILFDELEKYILPQLSAKPQIIFELSTSHNQPNFYQGDKDRICQILCNLLSNAMKFTEGGRIKLKCKYKVAERKFRFGVQDTGQGIPSNQLGNIFEVSGGSSYTYTVLSKHESKLTGMGLNISQMIASQMQTKINARSTLGVGSYFYFDLISPVLQSSRSSSFSLEEPQLCNEGVTASLPYVSQKNHDSGGTLDTLGSKLILIVDDMSTNRFVIKGLVRQFHTLIKIEEATNGLEALNQVKVALRQRTRQILIFMDLDMPVMNGFQSIAAIRRITTSANIFIIVVSAFTTEKERTECENLGIEAFTPKPVTKDIVMRAVYDYLLKT